MACNSGTSALILSLKYLGVGKGDEVVIPTYVFLDVLSAFFFVGATPKITEVLNWIKINTKTMYLNVIKKLEKKPNFILEKQSKNVRDILKCYPRQPQDGRIKWNKTSIYIQRLINASNKPYSGAYCFFKEKK